MNSFERGVFGDLFWVVFCFGVFDWRVGVFF